ncbi:glycoside hydrolase family 28 protein [Lacibacter sp.]|uniref:glycoside hydrolase family 28 protein n=1 Tax=Lacibacter sp. TaxID=1915409 RepID=UPI002B4B25ED|nr:glycosyl hydrolase family 28 protein [Lacibacter sp.]HLP36314.1 glycosyl hydrolase family 28 protein [Lacibacter sp.]
MFNKISAYRWLLLLFMLMPGVYVVAQKNKVCNVLEYGIVGDSIVNNTTAIQKLIDDCSAKGGATILFPKGQYIAGTILLKNNITLLIEEGASLIGSTDINDYQLVDPFKTGNGASMGYCFIGAVDAVNVSVTGKGRINGMGKTLLDIAGKSKRPFLMRFVRTTGITVKDVFLTNSAAWTCHFFASKNIQISGVSIYCKGLGNNDGFDIDCSQNVTISNCDVNTGDDALCFKTTWSKMPCKNIVVRNMRLSSNHAGIKWGTESMAAFENIKISNVYIYDTRNGGIKMNSVDGAQIRNVEITDVEMSNVRTPVLIRLGARLTVFRKEQDSRQPVGTIENIVFRNIKMKAAADAQLKPPTGILITGIPDHYIKNITLQNIQLSIVGGGNAELVTQIVPEAEKEYPEVRLFAPAVPAVGIWARHVKGLTISGFSLQTEYPDFRPAIFGEDVANTSITNSDLPVADSALAVVVLKDAVQALIENNKGKGNSKAIVHIAGTVNDRITIGRNTFNAVKKYSLEGTVEKNSIIIKN